MPFNGVENRTTKAEKFRHNYLNGKLHQQSTRSDVIGPSPT